MTREDAAEGRVEVRATFETRYSAASQGQKQRAANLAVYISDNTLAHILQKKAKNKNRRK
jgi:hypothetical protein